MSYVSENRLFDFVFHDSELSLISYDKEKLVLKGEFMNLSKNSPLNEYDCDMQLSEATITFFTFGANSVIKDSWWQKPYEEEGEDEGFFVKPRFTVDEKATEEFVALLEDTVSVQEFGIDETGYHYINACGKDGGFSAKFIYLGVTISWEEFVSPAWYERKR